MRKLRFAWVRGLGRDHIASYWDLKFKHNSALGWAHTPNSLTRNLTEPNSHYRVGTTLWGWDSLCALTRAAVTNLPDRTSRTPVL